MSSSRSLTAAEFDAVKHLLRISAQRIEAARLVMVEGQTFAGVASLFRSAPTKKYPDGKQWTRQAVFEAVRVVWETYEKFKEAEQAVAGGRKGRAPAQAGEALPPGWVEVTLRAPKAMVAKFRREVAQIASAELAAKATPSRRAARH